MHYSSSHQGKTQAQVVRTLLRQDYGFLTPRQPLVRVAKIPQRPRVPNVAQHARILPIEERRGTMLLGVIECHALRQVRVRCGWRSQPEQCPPQGIPCVHQHDRVVGLLCQGKELLTKGMCRLALGTDEIIIPQSTHHGENLVRVFQILAELPSVRVRLSDFRSCVTFGGKQRCSQSQAHVQLPWETLRGLGEHLEQREPLPEMSNGFHLARPLAGPLPSLVPVGNRLFRQPCFHIMMRYKFRLSFNRFWELCLKHLSNALMVVLPLAP